MTEDVLNKNFNRMISEKIYFLIDFLSGRSRLGKSFQGKIHFFGNRYILLTPCG